MNELWTSLVHNATGLPFTLAYLFMLLATISALLNIVVSPKDDFDVGMFAKRTLGSLIAVLILVCASVAPNLSSFMWAPIAFICLLMIREITVALKFLGLDLTPLTIFINIAIAAMKGKFGKQPPA
jgi:hypothetical protein